MAAAIVGWRITTTPLDRKFDIEMCFGIISGEHVQVGIYDLNFRWSDNICSGHNSFTTNIQVHSSGFHIMENQSQLFYLQHYLQDIFSDSKNITEFMQHIRNAD